MVAAPMPEATQSVARPGFLARALQLVEQGADDDRAGGAERVAHGDGAAIHIDHLAGVDLEGLQEAQHHGGEGLVDFEKVDIADGLMPLSARIFSVTGTGPVSMMVGSSADLGGGLDAGAGGEPVGLAEGLGADQHGGGAVDDAGAVAGMVDVIDLLKMRIFHQRHLVETGHDLAHLLEGLALSLRRDRPRMSVPGRMYSSRSMHGQAVLIDNRDDGSSRNGYRPRPRLCTTSAISTASASASSRVKPYSVAMISAEMPCGTKYWFPSRWKGSTAIAAPSEPMATRDIISTPPAI